jgi:ribose 5-phosphate isomerase B
MKIAIASDHAGFQMKEYLKNCLDRHEVVDFGVKSDESADYPIVSIKSAEAVADGSCDMGIIICGTGIGSSIAANKVKGIRAALCNCPDFARLSREHNNANILVLPGRFISNYLAANIVDIWLNTEFASGRHLNRINMIKKYEERGEL